MKIAYYTGWMLTRIVSRLLFRIRVVGREHIPREGGFIVATNHRSYFDPMLVGTWAPREVYFLAKQELFQNKLFGALISATNALPVKRGTIDRKAVDSCVETIDRGYGLTVFPEGTRARDREFLDPKPGLGMIATRAKVPVVPGYIHGSNRLMDCFLGRQKLAIYFDKPIPVSKIAEFGEDRQSYNELVTFVMNRIKAIKERVVGP
ncbi:MAG: 1-acyl-sn-glycerol-3-phosphate acyltransferase [Candidatus Zixiibacteriota bacterium]|nr:MAG: 1-acyl-sn-glycerol-3-phosphate acyltransferase [candidate division Zixibacteria bacterium]